MIVIYWAQKIGVANMDPKKYVSVISTKKKKD